MKITSEERQAMISNRKKKIQEKSRIALGEIYNQERHNEMKDTASKLAPKVQSLNKTPSAEEVVSSITQSICSKAEEELFDLLNLDPTKPSAKENFKLNENAVVLLAKMHGDAFQKKLTLWGYKRNQQTDVYPLAAVSKLGASLSTVMTVCGVCPPEQRSSLSMFLPPTMTMSSPNAVMKTHVTIGKERFTIAEAALYELINLDPNEVQSKEKFKLNERTVLLLARLHGSAFRKMFNVKGYKIDPEAKIFPLTAICALGASLPTIMAVYNVSPAGCSLSRLLPQNATHVRQVPSKVTVVTKRREVAHL